MKKILKFISTVENCLFIYRNYSTFSNPWKFLSYIGLICEIAWATFKITTRMLDFTSMIYKDVIPNIFYTVNIGYSIFTILFAMYHSKTFQTLVIYLSQTHAYLTMNVLYLENLNRKYKTVIYIYAVNSIAIATIQFHSYIVSDFFSSGFTVLLINTLDSIHLFVHKARVVTQWILIYSLLHILSEQLVALTSEISDENTTIISTVSEVVLNDQKVSFNKWTEIYTNIKISSDLMNTIFGLQITLYLVSTSVFLILIIYSAIFASVHSSLTPVEACLSIFKILLLNFIIVSLCRSAQRVRNCVDELRRGLGRLLIQSVSTNMQNYKEIKDFLRLTSNRPIRIQAFASIDVDMTLLPKYIMFFTSYTILALQINEVV